MNINIESEIIRVIDVEMKGLSLLREHIDSSEERDQIGRAHV